MKARKILIASIPLLASTAIVGSGFAAWYFGAETYSQNAGVSIMTTAQAEAGTFGTEDYTVILDQGHYANRSVANAGIYVVKAKSVDESAAESYVNAKNESSSSYYHVDNKCSIDATYSLTSDQAKNLYNADFDSVTVTAKMTIGSVLANYITFNTTPNTTPTGAFAISTSSSTVTSASISSGTSETVATWTWTVPFSAGDASLPTSGSTTISINADTVGATAINNLFVYKDGAKPLDGPSYSNLVAAMTSANSSFASDGKTYLPYGITLEYAAKLNVHSTGHQTQA